MILLLSVLLTGEAASGSPMSQSARLGGGGDPRDGSDQSVPVQDPKATLPERIDSITIENLGVFDPAIPRYRRFPYVLLNRLHIRTRPRVIRRELLFRGGDPFEEEVLLESERNLRLLPVNRAEITSAPGGGGRDIVVRTEDAWTLIPEFVVDSQGGASRVGVGIEEYNLFGQATSLRVRSVRGTDQNLGRVFYSDRRLFHSRWQMSASTVFGDGSLNEVQVNRPFYSLDTRWAASMLVTRERGFDRLYDVGALTARIPLSRENAAASVTRAWGNRVDKTKLSVGLDFERRDFVAAPAVFDESAASWQGFFGQGGGTRRNNIRLDVALDREHYRFVKDRFLDKSGQVEDVRVGYGYGVSAGPAEGLNGRPDYTALATRGVASRQVWGRHLVIASLAASTRREAAGFTNSLTSGFIHTYVRLPWQTLAVSLAGVYAARMDQPYQLVLGGDMGLRGYSARQFTGNRGVIVNVEHRVYTNVDLLTARLGFAVFADVGRLWRENERATLSSLKSSVGIGLRMGLTKSFEAPTVRLDLSLPLNPDGRRRPSFGFSVKPVFLMFNQPALTINRFAVE
ncbi:MAG: BamA/TamA family outer membrane protein [Cyanobacteria bacterium]|nr:BamA/TamA family outer membrane protein [Cyanobacteriota bacterium]